MALVKGTNSYASVLEGDAYFADRIDSTAWTSATEGVKAQALITATSILDDLIWTGSAVSLEQTLAFPRNGSFFDPRLGTDVLLSAVPSRIIRATFELAYHLIINDELSDDTGSLASLKIASLELTSIKKPSKIPNSVYRAIKPILLNAGSNSWWRAN